MTVFAPQEKLSWKFTASMVIVFAILFVAIWFMPPMPERTAFTPPFNAFVLGELLWVQGMVLFCILKSGLITIPLAILVLIASTAWGDKGNLQKELKR